MTVTLTEPIQAHGKEVGALEFRKPNGNDVRLCGYPFTITPNDDGSTTIKPDAGAISAMIARLAGIPPSSVGQLNFLDWNNCMGEVFSFFGQALPTSSSAASTLRGSGNGPLQ
jgi:hypothetical protein